MSWMMSKSKIEKLGIHASETAWVGTKFDAVFDNNSTLDHLYQQVKCLVQDLPGATASHS
jgi:dephospho-CoA kinase